MVTLQYRLWWYGMLVLVGDQTISRRQEPEPPAALPFGDILANLVATAAAARPPQFVVAKGHNIWVVTETLFAASGRHSSLWPKATSTFRRHEHHHTTRKFYTSAV